MKLIKSGYKYILYDDDGRIVIISTDRRICEGLMK
jgi:hypothetical protein